ncbi:hypothetical protein N9L90_00220 [Planctomycetota bacterium]|jgi:hypothetical protein|nr:hypothetical protein [Planctomycetota bacterium]
MRYLLLIPAGTLLTLSIFGFLAAGEATDPDEVLAWRAAYAALAAVVLLGTRWFWRLATPPSSA